MTTEHPSEPPEGPDNKDWIEKRQHERRPVKLTVKLTCGQISGEKSARDISLGGIFVETADEIAPGQELQLAIPFSNNERYIRMKGTVARITDDGIGVQFDVYSIDIE